MEQIWVFDIDENNVPFGPYSSKEVAEKDIQLIKSRNDGLNVSKPYQMSRDHLKKIILNSIDDSTISESMNDKEKKEFYARLQTEKVHFQYIELKTGKMRKAYGTLIPEELPSTKKSSDTKQEARDKMKKKRPFPSDSVFYYDLGPEPEHKGFRSFKMKNFDKYLDEK